MRKYEIRIICDNHDGVLMKVCTLFSARSYNIITIVASPIDSVSGLSHITLTTMLDSQKIHNVGEKLKQIVPVHTVEISELND